MDLYYRSVGHGANLLLNVAPDDRGLFPDVDVARLREFGDEIRRRFSHPLAQTAGQGMSLTLTLPDPASVDHVILMESIAEGERVREYILEGRIGNDWQELVHGSAVGHKKIDRFAPVTVTQLRWRSLESEGVPTLRRMAAYGVGT